jgi:hypothetical protein
MDPNLVLDFKKMINGLHIEEKIMKLALHVVNHCLLFQGLNCLAELNNIPTIILWL